MIHVLKKFCQYIVLILLISPAISGGIDVRDFANSQDKTRYENLIRELRCLVCQNQNLAESDADLANDMRDIVANMITDGASDNDIKQFLHARYGDFILYRPPLRANTWLLWLSPFALVVILLLLLPILSRRRAKYVNDTTLSPQQKAQVQHLLNSNGENNLPK